MPGRDHVNIWELSGLCTPWCVHVVATLRIADHLAGGITTIDDLAEASDADPEYLHRVLRHLVHEGVFEEAAPGRFVGGGTYLPDQATAGTPADRTSRP